MKGVNLTFRCSLENRAMINAQAKHERKSASEYVIECVKIVEAFKRLRMEVIAVADGDNQAVYDKIDFLLEQIEWSNKEEQGKNFLTDEELKSMIN